MTKDEKSTRMGHDNQSHAKGTTGGIHRKKTLFSILENQRYPKAWKKAEW